MNLKLIAPCGMNCAICVAYLRDKNKCPGCRMLGQKKDIKSIYCKKCSIRDCLILKENKWKYCKKTCSKYVCQRLKNLDKRYRTRYGMSMIKNLEYINKKGIRAFIKNQKKKYIKDGKILCIHNKKYYNIKK